MNPLAGTGLNIVDIRHLLPAHDWKIGFRTQTTSLTWHWNGGPVPDAHRSGDGLIQQLINDSYWQMRPGWGGTINGAPHLMYHLCVGADGQAYQTSEITEQLWHAAHQDANSNGLSLHFVLGQGQEPTPAQLTTGLLLSDALRDIYRIPRQRILGHLEWKHATACPGPALMRELLAYRKQQAPLFAPVPPLKNIRRFRLSLDLPFAARVRQGPGLSFPVATRLKPGTIVFVDITKRGEPVQGNPTWLHMARIENEQADAGFLSETLGTWL